MRVENPAVLTRDSKTQKPKNFKNPPSARHNHNHTEQGTSRHVLPPNLRRRNDRRHDSVPWASPPLQQRVILPTYFRRCPLCQRCSQYGRRGQQIIVARRAGSPDVASGFPVGAEDFWKQVSIAVLLTTGALRNWGPSPPVRRPTSSLLRGAPSNRQQPRNARGSRVLLRAARSTWVRKSEVLRSRGTA